MKKGTIFLFIAVAFCLGYLVAEEVNEKKHYPRTLIEHGAAELLLEGGEAAETGGEKPQTQSQQTTRAASNQHPDEEEEDEYGPDFRAIVDRYHKLRSKNREVTDVWNTCVKGKQVTVKYKTNNKNTKLDTITIDAKPESAPMK